MLTRMRWSRVLLIVALVVVLSAPQLASARGRGRGPQAPFLLTPSGMIRQSDYYAYMLTPQQRMALRATEDQWIANGMKPPGKGSKGKKNPQATATTPFVVTTPPAKKK